MREIRNNLRAAPYFWLSLVLSLFQISMRYNQGNCEIQPRLFVFNFQPEVYLGTVRILDSKLDCPCGTYL